MFFFNRNMYGLFGGAIPFLVFFTPKLSPFFIGFISLTFLKYLSRRLVFIGIAITLSGLAIGMSIKVALFGTLIFMSLSSVSYLPKNSRVKMTHGFVVGWLSILICFLVDYALSFIIPSQDDVWSVLARLLNRSTVHMYDNVGYMMSMTLFIVIISMWQRWPTTWQRNLTVLAFLSTLFMFSRIQCDAVLLSVVFSSIFIVFLYIMKCYGLFYYAVRGSYIGASCLVLAFPNICSYFFTFEKIIDLNTLHLLPMSWIHRLYIWKTSSDRILEHWVRGYGFDISRQPEFLSYYQKYAQTLKLIWPDGTFSMFGKMGKDFCYHPHNIILQMWLDFGVLGALALVAIIIGCFEYILRNMRETYRISLLNVYVCSAFFACVNVYTWHLTWLSIVTFSLYVVLATKQQEQTLSHQKLINGDIGS